MRAGNKVVRCECGYEARALDEEGLLAELRRHAREAHAIEFSREDALLVVLRSELELEQPLDGPSERA
jgi:predicted small metal-binding protein